MKQIWRVRYIYLYEEDVEIDTNKNEDFRTARSKVDENLKHFYIERESLVHLDTVFISEK